MNNYKKIYISSEEFAQRKAVGLFYVGFVKGAGYAYTLDVAIKPAHMGTSEAPRFVPPGQDRYQYVKMQFIDNSDEAVQLSYGERPKLKGNKAFIEASESFQPETNYATKRDNTAVSPDYFGNGGGGNEVAKSQGGWTPSVQGEIRQYEPSLMDRWSENTNFFSKMGYDLVDGVWVLGQSLVSGPRSEVTHLNGTPTISDERVMAFGNTVSWAITAGELSTFKGITNGVYSSRWELRIQAHAHSMSPPKGMVSFSMSPWHINFNKIHIITNPIYWRSYGLIFIP